MSLHPRHGPSTTPTFHCAHLNSTSTNPLPTCPPLIDSISSCLTPGGNATAAFTSKAGCLSYCNSLFDGSYLKTILECTREECSDAEEHEEHNREAHELVIEEDAHLCEHLGLGEGAHDHEDDVEDDHTHDEEGHSHDEEEEHAHTEEEEKEHTQDEEKEEPTQDEEQGQGIDNSDVEVEPTTVDDEEEEEATKDSAAVGLGAKKGLMVLALVFGSVFSGLMI